MTPAPMAPLISSNFLATLEAADLRLLKPTNNSALRAFRFCGLYTEMKTTQLNKSIEQKEKTSEKWDV